MTIPEESFDPQAGRRRDYRSIPFPVFLAGAERNEIFDSGASMIQKGCTFCGDRAQLYSVRLFSTIGGQL